MMTRAMVLGAALACAGLGGACGGGARPAPVSARGGDTAAFTEPEAVLRALADAARRDDGAALDALIHPSFGLVLWDQPGATVGPSVTVRADDGRPPSKRLTGAQMNPYWLENYWPAVAGGIDGGLTQLDLEPADRHADVYGSCAEDDSGGPDPRAWLVASDSFDDTLRMIAEDTQLQLDAKVQAGLVHFHAWGLDVWMVRDQGRLWVAHVMVWTPCDA